MFLDVTGSAELPLGAQSATVAFDGTFALCPAEVAVSYFTPYRCPIQPTTCRSSNHRLLGRVNKGFSPRRTAHGERGQESEASQPRAGASLLVGFAARLMPSSPPRRRQTAKTQEPHDVPFTRHQ
jgi:hypothetical protein